MGPTVYETQDEMWDAMFNINVTTLRTVLRTAVPALLQQQGGSIVNVGALGALKGAGNMGAYTAAKSTVMRLTEALSEEVKAQGINVNAVLPSIIDTPANRGFCYLGVAAGSGGSGVLPGFRCRPGSARSIGAG